MLFTASSQLFVHGARECVEEYIVETWGRYCMVGWALGHKLTSCTVFTQCIYKQCIYTYISANKGVYALGATPHL